MRKADAASSMPFIEQLFPIRKLQQSLSASTLTVIWNAELGHTRYWSRKAFVNSPAHRGSMNSDLIPATILELGSGSQKRTPLGICCAAQGSRSELLALRQTAILRHSKRFTPPREATGFGGMATIRLVTLSRFLTIFFVIIYAPLTCWLASIHHRNLIEILCRMLQPGPSLIRENPFLAATVCVSKSDVRERWFGASMDGQMPSIAPYRRAAE
ncbi:MAG: hypothetical protein BGO12_20580 [Verrucomicrobia bacterium 61-8]|nr:MAG: hypothetical protein BGO12_20580 [Verrucomicrobia bacterium 61-8]